MTGVTGVHMLQLIDAGHTELATQYAQHHGLYFVAAKLLVDAGNVPDAVIAVLRASTIDVDTRKEELLALADRIIVQPLDLMFGVILYHRLGLRDNWLLDKFFSAALAPAIARKFPSLIELSLWRIAQNFTTAHPQFLTTETVSALVQLRATMVSDLFEALSLPLCLLWPICNDMTLLMQRVVRYEAPLVCAHAAAYFFVKGIAFQAGYAAALVTNRIFYPIVHAVTDVNSPARKPAYNQLLRPIVSLFHTFYEEDETQDMLEGFVLRLLSDEKRAVSPNESTLPDLQYLPEAVAERIANLVVSVAPMVY